MENMDLGHMDMMDRPAGMAGGASGATGDMRADIGDIARVPDAPPRPADDAGDGGDDGAGSGGRRINWDARAIARAARREARMRGKRITMCMFLMEDLEDADDDGK